MAPKPLFDMASAVATKNIKSVLSIGYLPYQTVRHILIRVDSAPQLRQIELNCPQLQGETGELWLKLIEKDFPMELKAKGYKPKDEDKWHRVWEKYKRDHDRSIQESEEQLRSALLGLREDKAKNTSKIVEGRFLPSDAMRPKKRLGPKDNSTSVLSFGSGSRTKMLTGAGVMRKARREAREVRHIQGALSRTTTAPIRVLEKRHLPSAPPKAMLQEQRIAAQPVYRTPEVEQREQREQQMRSQALDEHTQRAAFISDSEEDSEDDARVYQPAKASMAPRSSKPSTTSRSPRPADFSPPARAGPSAASPARKPSMFQRKFGSGAGKPLAPTPATRIITSTSNKVRPSTPPDVSSVPKKRTSSQANLGERAGTGKRSVQERAPVSPNVSKVSASSPKETADKLSGPSSPESVSTSAMPMRKKKAVNIFMKKRPVKRG